MNVFANRFVLVCGLLIASFSFADAIPRLPKNLQCMSNQRTAMPFNNETVMRWKQETNNQYKDRGFVQGVVTDVYPLQTNSKGQTHTKFAMDIDQKSGGDIEIIYNDEFGDLPKITIGMKVVACGDYITVSSSQNPSPMGAIIHWIHMNPGTRDGGKHPHGFLILNNIPYGLEAPTQLN